MAKHGRSILEIAREVDLMGTYDDYDSEELIEVLKAADDAYHNIGDPLMTDASYDTLRRHMLASIPEHSYFTGVGSEVRGGKVPLPYPMGSLDQVEVGEIAKWSGDNGLEDSWVVATDKLDGISALIIYDENGKFQIAYSRGNGIEGADISRHVRKLRSVPLKFNSGGERVVVRGEIIISKSNFPKAQKTQMSSSGKPYKNARNMVAGLMNASENTEGVYQFVDFVAYEVVKPDDCMDYMQQLKFLTEYGFGKRVGSVWTGHGSDLYDEDLADLLAERREKCIYEIDGLVISVDSLIVRERLNPTRDTLNPGHSIKYKVQDASNLAITTVVNVEWNMSKHGYLKPRVQVEPVELVGVTITNATGFNAKFIEDNGIGYGAQVQITRSGDVIPFIQEVIEPAMDGPQMPEVDWHWSENNVDAIADERNVDAEIEMVVAFFASIDAPLLKKGNVEKLFDAGYCTTEEIICAEEHELKSVIGSNGVKIYAGLRQRLTGIPQYKLMGSTTFFGRGVGVRKLRKLQSALGQYGMIGATVEEIALVEGFDKKTAEKIVAGTPAYLDWLEEIEDRVVIADEEETAGGALEGHKVVFTGFRNAAWAEQVEAQGGEMQSGVSGKTTILVASNPNSNSGKMKKARANGTQIMGLDEFGELLGA